MHTQTHTHTHFNTYMHKHTHTAITYACIAHAHADTHKLKHVHAQTHTLQSHAHASLMHTQAEALAWSKLLVVRDGVNGALEQARTAKVGHAVFLVCFAWVAVCACMSRL